MAFWTEPQMASIRKMLNPRSIAIVGATPRMQYGGRFLAAALKAKDRIRVYAVNPRYDEIMGVKSYPNVTDLPEAPDVVAVVVPWDQVLDVLQESHRKGAGSAIVISAGFAERGVDDRRDLQGELGAFASTSGMRISGPNCLGLANVKDDIWATASSRGAEGLTGPIGLVCQSGATAFGPFLVRAVENGIGFSYIISRERGRPRLYRFRPLSAGRSGYSSHCRFCRRLRSRRQISRSGKARRRARQA